MQPVRSDSSIPQVAGAARLRGDVVVRLAAMLTGAGVVVALDQFTKSLIRSWLAIGEGWPGGWELIRLTHYENSGAAFGIMQGGGGFLTITSIIVIGAVLAFLWWAPPQARLYSIALSLILGGAIGNLIDRLARGTVTDFIDPTRYPAFNVADSSIVIGVCILAGLSLLDERQARRAADAGAAAADQQAST